MKVAARQHMNTREVDAFVSVDAIHIDNCGLAVTEPLERDTGYRLTHLNTGMSLARGIPDVQTAMAILEIFKGVSDRWSLSLVALREKLNVASKLAMQYRLDQELKAGKAS